MKINKSKLNLSIDIIMFIVLMAIAGIGFMIKYVLVPGFKRNGIYGRDVELFYWGLDRHQWGCIHLIISGVLLMLLILHIIFHWKMILSIFKNMFSKKSTRVILTISFVLISLVFGIMPLFVKPEIQEGISHYSNQNNNGYHKNINRLKENSQSNDEVSKELISNNLEEKNYSKNTQKNSEHKHTEQYSIDIDGKMTLNEVSAKYNIPVTELALFIKIPEKYTNEKLGRLRKQYSFNMDNLRDYIESKNK